MKIGVCPKPITQDLYGHMGNPLLQLLPRTKQKWWRKYNTCQINRNGYSGTFVPYYSDIIFDMHFHKTFFRAPTPLINILFASPPPTPRVILSIPLYSSKHILRSDESHSRFFADVSIYLFQKVPGFSPSSVKIEKSRAVCWFIVLLTPATWDFNLCT